MRLRYLIMLTVDRSTQAEPWLSGLLKANVMRQGLEDQGRGA